MIDIQPGDRVRVRESWATSATPRVAGRVKQVYTSERGGQWATVRFDGHTDDHTLMVRELELA